MKRRRSWQVPVGFLISALFLWLAVRGLEPGRVWQYVGEARFIWLVPAVLAYFVTVAVRTWRWQYLLRPLKSLPFTSLFAIVVIGYLGNNIYPLRAGELLRVHVLKRRAAVPHGAGLATLLVERVFDGLGILSLVFLALPLTSMPAPELAAIVQLTAVLFVAALVTFLLLAMYPESALRWFGLIVERWLPTRWQARLIGLGNRFVAGLIALRSPGKIVALFLASILIWILETFKFWLVMRAFPFVVSFAALALTNGIINLATILPSAPGFVGTFDLPGITMLTLFGIQEEVATAYTLVLHAVLWLPSTLFGGLYVIYSGLRWADLSYMARADEISPVDY